VLQEERCHKFSEITTAIPLEEIGIVIQSVSKDESLCCSKDHLKPGMFPSSEVRVLILFRIGGSIVGSEMKYCLIVMAVVSLLFRVEPGDQVFIPLCGVCFPFWIRGSVNTEEVSGPNLTDDAQSHTDVLREGMTAKEWKEGAFVFVMTNLGCCSTVGVAVECLEQSLNELKKHKVT